MQKYNLNASIAIRGLFCLRLFYQLLIKIKKKTAVDF